MRPLLLCIIFFSTANTKPVLDELENQRNKIFGLRTSPDAKYDPDGSTPFRVATGTNPASPQEIDPAAFANQADSSTDFFQLDPDADSSSSQRLGTLETSTGSGPSELESSIYKLETSGVSASDAPVGSPDQGAADEGADSFSFGEGNVFGSTGTGPNSVASVPQFLGPQNAENAFGNSAEDWSVQIGVSTSDTCLEDSTKSTSKKRGTKEGAGVCVAPKTPKLDPETQPEPKGSTPPFISGPGEWGRRRCGSNKGTRKVTLCCNGPPDPVDSPEAKRVKQCFLCAYAPSFIVYWKLCSGLIDHDIYHVRKGKNAASKTSLFCK